VMEYRLRTAFYLDEAQSVVNYEAGEGFTLKSLTRSDGLYLAVLERERAEGT